MGRWSFEALQHLPERALQTVFARGVRPQFAELAGYEFHGFNPPAFAKLAGIQRFIKGFYQKAGDPPAASVERIYGYNLFCSPKAPTGEWRALPDDVTPQRHGFYDVYDPTLTRHGKDFAHSLLLDYGVPENHGLNPERVIRDYLVQVSPDDPTVLLGKAFLKLGPAHIHSNFFLLRRFRAHHYRP
jgi:hypothetical protein